jgi:hypothetical protein
LAVAILDFQIFGTFKGYEPTNSPTVGYPYSREGKLLTRNAKADLRQRNALCSENPKREIKSTEDKPVQ